MEAAIVAALVAGAVSLVGVLVNLRIARETREANKDQVRLTAAIRASEESVKVLTAQMAKVERVRVACWDIDDLLRPESTASKEELLTAAEQFGKQVDEFLDSWAEAKGEIPPPQLRLLRRIRHDCKNIASSVFWTLKELAEEQRTSGGAKRPAQVHQLERLLEQLLMRLDDLFYAVSSARFHRFAEVISDREGRGADAYNTGGAADG